MSTERKIEADKILTKYPDRIPIICNRDSKSSDINILTKKKFLVPKDLTLGQFIFILRKKINMSAEKALFIFINNTLLPIGTTIGTIYEDFKDEDGFLMITYSGENTFGF